MARVPFIGRLFWREYIALAGSLILIFLEGLIRVITLGLPQPVIGFCYNRSKNLFNSLSSTQSNHSSSRQKSIVSSIAGSSDFVDLCGLFGYYAEEHVVQTGDGYLLGLHRLCWRKGEEDVRVNAGEGSVQKRAVYLHHGLLMNSEVWVCMTEQQRCLPFILVEKGYDVWLGNNRGNKYSKKSTRFSPSSNSFWDFSMDQFAFHDIPDSIDYVLATTSQPSLSYVGFSQGTAQAFATLSIHPTLNDKIDVFIALAPAMSPAGLRNGVVDSLVKASPEVLFLAFGRRSILSSATMWQSILYPPIFVRILDMSLSFLFNWSGRNITYSQKLAAYPHLYSFTSTKCVVHWFQIIRNKSFQMYDDDVQTPLGLGASDRYYKVAKFPTRNIKTPVVLIYGGSDSLVDIKVMLKELPRHTTAKEVPHYEHLDFLWGQEVESLVFPHVFESLTAYAGRDHMYSSTVLYGNRRQKRLVLGEDSEDDYSSPANDDMTELNAEANRNRARYDDARVTPSPKKRSPSSFIDQKSLLSSSSTEHNSASADGSSDLGQAGSKTDSVFGRNRKYTNKRNKSIIRATSNGSTKKVSEGGIALGAGKATTGIINSPSPPSRNMDRTLKRTS
ncbi:cholesterol esterase [Puttea exsequens]|nr:cholesterol esterase [Puttea exsequens]